MLETSRNEFQPDYMISPCEVLCYELELREMNQRELVRRTGVTYAQYVLVPGEDLSTTSN